MKYDSVLKVELVIQMIESDAANFILVFGLKDTC